jgi:hypothetical protein
MIKRYERRLGIRRVRKWLSRVFTRAEIAVLSSARLSQVKDIEAIFSCKLGIL